MPTRSRRSERAAYGTCLALLGVLSIAARGYLTAGCRPALYWDSPSYLDYARAWLERPLYFLAPHFRPFGYPLLLIAAGGPTLDLGRVVLAQQALGVIAVLLLFDASYRLTRHLGFSLAIGLQQLLLWDLIYMELAIYSEPLAVALTAAAVWTFARVWSGGRRRSWPAVGLGASIGLLVFVRPVTQFALPVVGLALAWGAWRRQLGWRPLAMFVLLALMPVAAYGGLAWVRTGKFRIVSQSYVNVLNYVGHPAMFTRLPPDMDDVRQLYLELAAREGLALDQPVTNRLRLVGWNMTVAPLAERAARQGRSADYDDVALETASRAIGALPGTYLRLWLGVVREYLSSYSVGMGVYPTHEIRWEPANAQVNPRLLPWIERNARWGRRLMPWLTGTALAMPLILISVRSRPWRRRDALIALGAMLWALLLGNTLLEPSPGQHRYRMPLEPTYVLVAEAGLFHLARAARRAYRLRTISVQKSAK